MANNELNIHGANLEDLQKTADRCSKPEDLAASQPESPAEAADQYAESEYSESSGQQETADQHSRQRLAISQKTHWRLCAEL